MRTVDSSKYDRHYFEESIGTTLHKLKDGKNHILDKIVNLLPLKESDLVVDFGCGTGLLCFSLYEKYRCRVVGIDYSEDAIALCKEYNSVLKYDNVTFLRSDISSLPRFENVIGIYLADVIEHLYDEEIDALFEIIGHWQQNNEQNFHVVIHTDNLIYLKYVRWFVDLVSLICRKTSYSELSERNRFDKERHVNLMTLSSLSMRMKRYGYILERIEYPEITEERLKSQLGPLASLPLIPYLLRSSSYKLIKYLSPSFYYCFIKRDN